MTRGRTVWLALLALGLAVALLLRTPKKPHPAPEPRAVASGTANGVERTDEVEIEIAEPSAVGMEPAPPASAASAAPSNEEDLVRALASTWNDDPERTLVLAAEGERRFGDGPHAVERRLYEIKALVKLGRIGSARTKAERFLALYPPGPMTEDVERLTGVHPRPPE
jgi:hypothetical protein